MLRQPDWDFDREIGSQAEMWVSSLREALKGGTVEVKHDTRAMQTGNLYVEYECRRGGIYRPSGIQTTKADVWVFVVLESKIALVIETQELKRLCAQPGIRIAEERDGSHPTKGYLVPMVYIVRGTR
jgi:hypothetical protein